VKNFRKTKKKTRFKANFGLGTNLEGRKLKRGYCMINLTYSRGGLLFETHFHKAIPYSDAAFRDWGTKALDCFGSAGLAPSAIVAKPGDRLYGFNFSFSIGKATFKLSAKKLEVAFLDATTKIEAQGMFQFLRESLQILSPSIDDISNFQIYGHASFKSDNDKIQFVKTVALPDGVTLGGAIVYSVVEGWNREIRFQIDKSVALKDALFVLIGTSIQGLITPEIVTTVCKSFEKLISKMGFNFEEDFERKSTT
jgi:hypothetical protein